MALCIKELATLFSDAIIMSDLTVGHELANWKLYFLLPSLTAPSPPRPEYVRPGSKPIQSLP